MTSDSAGHVHHFRLVRALCSEYIVLRTHQLTACLKYWLFCGILDVQRTVQTHLQRLVLTRWLRTNVLMRKIRIFICDIYRYRCERIKGKRKKNRKIRIGIEKYVQKTERVETVCVVSLLVKYEWLNVKCIAYFAISSEVCRYLSDYFWGRILRNFQSGFGSQKQRLGIT